MRANQSTYHLSQILCVLIESEWVGGRHNRQLITALIRRCKSLLGVQVVMCTARPGLTWLRLGDIMSRALGLRSGSAQAWLRLRPWLGKARAQAAQATAAVA